MVAPPPTRYARSGDAQLAFQVMGEGPPDVVLVGGPASHLDIQWEDPETARAWRRYASFARRHKLTHMADNSSRPRPGSRRPGHQTSPSRQSQVSSPERSSSIASGRT